MIRWIKQKLFYAKIKREIFNAFEHGDEFFSMLNKLAISLKDATFEEVRHEFISALAGFAHEQAEKDRKKKNGE